LACNNERHQEAVLILRGGVNNRYYFNIKSVALLRLSYGLHYTKRKTSIGTKSVRYN